MKLYLGNKGVRVQTVGELIEELNKYDKSMTLCSKFNVKHVGGSHYWITADLLMKKEDGMLILYPQAMHEIGSLEWETSLRGKNLGKV